MNETRYFVVVFGDPEPDRDHVESGTYTAEHGYPPFEAEPGDMLLLYCTSAYARYPMQVPGIGKVTSATRAEIRYEWRQLPRPILRPTILAGFEPEDRQKMKQLRFNVRRVFQISAASFSHVVDQARG